MPHLKMPTHMRRNWSTIVQILTTKLDAKQPEDVEPDVSYLAAA